MPLDPVKHRWLVAAGAVLVQLALGAIYAWNVFTPYLRKAPYDFTKAQTQIIFSVGLATFAVVMVLAGRWMTKVGPRRVAISGGLLLGTGYLLAGLFGSSFWPQVLFIGLVGGAGIGLGYVTPIAVGMRWFPDKKGLITGLAVAGFGLGALFWILLAGPLWGHLLDSFEILGRPTVQSVFMLYGLIFAAMVLVGARWMVYPPDGWKPAGYEAPQAAAGAVVAGAVEFESNQMLRTPQYFMLLFTFVFSSLAGLMTIGIVALFGTDSLTTSGVSEAAVKSAASLAGVVLALFNGAGRIVWGRLADSFGWKRSLVTMTTLLGLVMLGFFWMGSSVVLLLVGAALVGFFFGGNFALFPLATADLFGSRSVGRNYGWVFLAYGVGGIVGPIMAGAFGDRENWLPAFVISGVLCFVAAGISSRIVRPKAPA